MRTTTQQKVDSDPVAVIRCYQPVRIERELIAQVFELAERGSPDTDDDHASQHVGAEQTASQHENVSTQHCSRTQLDNRQAVESEAVA